MSGMWGRGVSSQSINTPAPHLPLLLCNAERIWDLIDYYFPTFLLIQVVAPQLTERQEDKRVPHLSSLCGERHREER